MEQWTFDHSVLRYYLFVQPNVAVINGAETFTDRRRLIERTKVTRFDRSAIGSVEFNILERDKSLQF